jgi:hypothetical protein
MPRTVLDADRVAAQAHGHGGVVESVERWTADEEGRQMCRMVLSWR